MQALEPKNGLLNLCVLIRSQPKTEIANVYLTAAYDVAGDTVLLWPQPVHILCASRGTSTNRVTSTGWTRACELGLPSDWLRRSFILRTQSHVCPGNGHVAAEHNFFKPSILAVELHSGWTDITRIQKKKNLYTKHLIIKMIRLL